MAKTRKKKNPSMVITNQGGNGKKGRARGFFGRIFNRVVEDGKIAAGCYLGGEIGQVGAEVGERHLSKTAGKYAVPAGQLALWFALTKLKLGGWAHWLR